jgi:predicted outer membrane repeat protein
VITRHRFRSPGYCTSDLDHDGALSHVRGRIIADLCLPRRLPFLQADNGTIIIDQSLFYNNTCLSSGGALYTTFSNITITNTNFLNNTASSGAAIKVYRSDVS